MSIEDRLASLEDEKQYADMPQTLALIRKMRTSHQTGKVGAVIEQMAELLEDYSRRTFMPGAREALERRSSECIEILRRWEDVPDGRTIQ